MTLMRARRAMVYDGRNLVAGELFECLAHDVSVLVKGGLAELAGEDNPTAFQKKRQYKRRDLKAEE